MDDRQALGAGYAAVAGTSVLVAGIAAALKGRARTGSAESPAMDRNGAHDPAPTGLPHGAVQAPVFDSRTGAVRHGPATQPLAGTRITERGGDIYALNG